MPTGAHLMRAFTSIDKILIEFEHGLRSCHIKPETCDRPYPARNQLSAELDETETRLVSGLMRVNNAGEVAAQGLYRGQAVSAVDATTSEDLLFAARQENEHLNWCQTRLQELGARRSLLDPVWYWGSFAIGSVVGLFGDSWSLGFVEETEKQVSHHLQQHLHNLPNQDQRSEAILKQMQIDEQQHAQQAKAAGAAELPEVVKNIMARVSRIMTRTAYYL